MALRTPLSVTPHLYMGDSTGRPLDMGTVYFGEQDKDPEFYPIALYSDDALTLPLMQPVHTKGGYLYDKGDMVEPHAKEIIYSVKVLDSYGRKVFYKGAMMRNSWNDDVIEQINTAIIGSAEAARQVATDITNEAINNTAVEGGVLADTFLTATAYHPDTYARTQRSIRADTISLLDFIPTALHEGIRAYTYADNIAPYMQKAVDYCTANNKELYCPAGGYMIDPATHTNVGVYLINNWGRDKSLIVTGAGQGLTVFREKAGATNIGGRYTKMFYVQCGLGTSFVGDFGHIKFSNMSFDKNGRSNTNPLRQAKIDAGLPITTAERFPYEQAHIFSLAGKGTVNLETVLFENIELIDKIGGGLNFSSSQELYIRKITMNNVISRNNSKVEIWGDDTFGTRGCLEFGTNIGIVDLNNCDVEYAQIEPVIPSSPTLRRHSNVSGGRIDAFEWTDKGGYSYANVVNLTCSYKLLTRGINLNATGCTFRVPDFFKEGTIRMNLCTILLPYDSETNTVTPLYHHNIGTEQAYGEFWLSNSSINIDSPDPDVRPTGYGMTGGTGMRGGRKRFLDNVKFDSRLEMSIDAYRNGDWKISNCDLYGTLHHVAVGGVDIGGIQRGGSVELFDNSYLGSGTKVAIFRNNLFWDLKVSGTYPLLNFFTFTGSVISADSIKQFPVLVSPTKPTNQLSYIGQCVINTNPVVGEYAEWIKVEEVVSSSSWKGVGLIEGDAAARTSGTTAQRPTGVVVGFTYFDTTLGKPIYFKSEGVWVDSAGATV